MYLEIWNKTIIYHVRPHGWAGHNERWFLDSQISFVIKTVNCLTLLSYTIGESLQI